MLSKLFFTPGKGGIGVMVNGNLQLISGQLLLCCGMKDKDPGMEDLREDSWATQVRQGREVW